MIVSLAEVEKHEKVFCQFMDCKKCNKRRFCEEDSIRYSLLGHQELQCKEAQQVCHFCKGTFTRRELMNEHMCDSVYYPAFRFMIKPEMVLNSFVIPDSAKYRSLTSCHFCGNYLRKAL